MKRFLLPNAGANLKNTQVAIALSIAECQKLGVQDFTVVVGTKENFESTEIGKLLGNRSRSSGVGWGAKCGDARSQRKTLCDKISN